MTLLSGLACPAPAECIAVGFDSGSNAAVVDRTTDGGATWSAVAIPGNVGDLYGVSCPSTLDCVAVGQDGRFLDGVALTTTDGGLIWNSATVPSGVGSLNAIACTSEAACIAVGQDGASASGVALGTTKGGATWTAQIVPSGVGSLDGIACTSATACIAVGQDATFTSAVAIGTSTAGSSWSAESLPAGAGSLSSVSCGSATDCVATGANPGGSAGAALFTSNAGASWSSDPLPAGAGRLNGTACPGATTCFAVGSDDSYGGPELLSTSDGVNWTSQAIPAAATELEAISCIDSTNCWAAGGSGTAAGILTSTSTPAAPVVDGLSPPSGPTAGGQTVRIDGTGLAGATAVSFGGTPATSFKGLSGTALDAVAPAGSAGTVDVSVTAPSGTSTTVAADRYTYLAPAPYHPVRPFRICDTRPANGTSVLSNQCDTAGNHTLASGSILTVTVAGNGAVPSTGVSAVVLNVTAADTTAASYLTVWPGGTAQPLASNLNWTSGEVVANLVTVGLGPGGAIDVANAYGATDVLIDVQGYYQPASGTAGLYNPLDPARICDTRPANGTTVTANQCDTGGNHTLGSGSILTVTVDGNGKVPSTGVSAVVLNVTATGTTAVGGYLTIYPAGTTRPIASNLNFGPGASVPNRVIMPVGTGANAGRIDVYNYSGSTDVLVDVGGWFTDGSSPSQTGADFNALTPSRICDTRSVATTNPCSGKTLGAPAPLAVAVDGHGGIPATGPAALVANVTATGTTAWSYLTVWPEGGTQPGSSDLNWSGRGVTVPNLVVVRLGSGGVDIANAFGSTDVIVDVVGWYA